MVYSSHRIFKRTGTRILRWFKEFLRDRCDVVYLLKGDYPLYTFYCVRKYPGLEAYSELYFRLRFDDWRNLIIVETVVTDNGEMLHSFSTSVRVGGRLKRSQLVDFFEKVWKTAERVVDIVESETAEEYKRLENYLRKFDLNKKSLNEFFFETLIPFKGVDFYKYRKLRRILEIRLKHEGREI